MIVEAPQFRYYFDDFLDILSDVFLIGIYSSQYHSQKDNDRPQTMKSKSKFL